MAANRLLEKTAAHVRGLYDAHADENLIYHTLSHTESVVKAAEQIADHYQLDEQDYLAVCIGAWFHDTGYLFGGFEEHEQKGAELAVDFLKKEQASPELIEKVRQCVLATRLTCRPATLIEEIMADADLFHLGTEQFRESNKKMRKEMELRCGKKIAGEQWRKSAIIMLKQHDFRTDYARALLQKGKLDNIARLETRQEEQEQKALESEAPASQPGKAGGKKPGRGIETMFRTTSVNHLRLSEMADNKAHILLTINSIIVSILVALLFRRLDGDSQLLIPGLMFITTSLITIVFAVLVTRPNVTSGVFTKEDIRNKTANLLFFGNFHRMNLEDYQWGVKQMMDDADFLYGSMTRDIYNLGVVLGRKYKLLRYAYTFFTVGFIVSALSFVFVVIS